MLVASNCLCGYECIISAPILYLSVSKNQSHLADVWQVIDFLFLSLCGVSEKVSPDQVKMCSTSCCLISTMYKPWFHEVMWQRTWRHGDFMQRHNWLPDSVHRQWRQLKVLHLQLKHYLNTGNTNAVNIISSTHFNVMMFTFWLSCWIRKMRPLPSLCGVHEGTTSSWLAQFSS